MEPERIDEALRQAARPGSRRGALAAALAALVAAPVAAAAAKGDGKGKAKEKTARKGGSGDGGRQACASRGQRCTGTVACCTGLVCNGGTCTPGSPGTYTVVGPTGPQGPQGSQGPQGPQGRASTTAGPAGTPGLAAPTGPQGPVGPGGYACTVLVSGTTTLPIPVPGPTGGWVRFVVGAPCPDGTAAIACGHRTDSPFTYASTIPLTPLPPGAPTPGNQCYGTFTSLSKFGLTGPDNGEIFTICAGGDSYCGA